MQYSGEKQLCKILKCIPYIWPSPVQFVHSMLIMLRMHSCIMIMSYLYQSFIPQQQNAMGSLRNIDFGWFRCVLGELGRFVLGTCSRFDGFWQVPGPQGGFDGFGRSGFRWVRRFGKGLQFRLLWSSGVWWVLMVSKVSGFDGVPKVPGPRAAKNMWDQVLAILRLAQCGVVQSECMCVKGIVKPPCCWGYRLRLSYFSATFLSEPWYFTNLNFFYLNYSSLEHRSSGQSSGLGRTANSNHLSRQPKRCHKRRYGSCCNGRVWNMSSWKRPKHARKLKDLRIWQFLIW